MHELQPEQVRAFLEIATTHLWYPMKSTLWEYCTFDAPPMRRSWCAWTSFNQLERNAVYWTAELPLTSELYQTYIGDGGTWGQPFLYEDIAHIIIPRLFEEEHWRPSVYTAWNHEQDIDGLSGLLTDQGIDHYVSRYALEVKRF